jgi:hypothetical protein
VTVFIEDNLSNIKSISRKWVLICSISIYYKISRHYKFERIRMCTQFTATKN